MNQNIIILATILLLVMMVRTCHAQDCFNSTTNICSNRGECQADHYCFCDIGFVGTVCHLKPCNSRVFGFGTQAIGKAVTQTSDFTIYHHKAIQTDLLNTRPLSKAPIIMLDTGENHVIFASEFEVMVMGSNADGQLGKGSVGYYSRPTKLSDEMSIEGYSFKNEKIKAISAGLRYSVIVTTQHVYAFGKNEHGQLGINTITAGEFLPIEMKTSTNTSITTEHTFLDVSLGFRHSLLLTEEKQVMACGSNIYGQLGIGSNDLESSIMKPITALNMHNITQAKAGKDFSIVLTASGELYGWGLNDVNQLGTYTPYGSSSLPILVYTNHIIHEEFNERFTELAVGMEYAFVLTSEGALYGWGHDKYGSLGQNDSNTYDYNSQPERPLNMTSIPLEGNYSQWNQFHDGDASVWKLYAGFNSYFGMVLDSKWQIYGWGDNYEAELSCERNPKYPTHDEACPNPQPKGNVYPGAQKIEYPRYKGAPFHVASSKGMTYFLTAPLSTVDECKCPKVGYSGDDCDIFSCFGEPIESACNNGTCVAPNTCVCDKGYGGYNCQQRTCFGEYGTISSCSAHGACNNDNGTIYNAVDNCICFENYNGESCQGVDCGDGGVYESCGGNCANGYFGSTCSTKSSVYPVCNFYPDTSGITCQLGYNNPSLSTCRDYFDVSSMSKFGVNPTCSVSANNELSLNYNFADSIQLPTLKVGDFLNLRAFPNDENSYVKVKVLKSNHPNRPSASITFEAGNYQSPCYSTKISSTSTSPDRYGVTYKWSAKHSHTQGCLDPNMEVISNYIGSNSQPQWILPDYMVSTKSKCRIVFTLTVTSYQGIKSKTENELYFVPTDTPKGIVSPSEYEYTYIEGLTVPGTILNCSLYPIEYLNSEFDIVSKTFPTALPFRVVNNTQFVIDPKSGLYGDYEARIRWRLTYIYNVTNYFEYEFRVILQSKELVVFFNNPNVAKTSDSSFYLIDGAGSYDPDDVDITEQVSWRCFFASTQAPCSGFVDYVYEHHQKTKRYKELILEPSYITSFIGESLIIQMRLKKGNRENSAYITVQIEKSHIPVSVNPIPSLIHRKDELTVIANISDNNPVEKVEWSINSWNDEKFQNAVKFMSTDQLTVTFKANQFVEGSSYQFSITVFRGVEEGFASVITSVSISPVAGTVNIFPDSGTVSKTEYNMIVDTSSWEPFLLFTFYYMDPLTNDTILLRERSPVSSFSTEMPIYGKEENNYKIPIIVKGTRILDGSYSERLVYIQVEPVFVVDTGGAFDEVEAGLEDISSKEDPLDDLQFIVTVLNTKPRNLTTVVLSELCSMCLNRGMCEDSRCRCAIGYSGRFCEIQESPEETRIRYRTNITETLKSIVELPIYNSYNCTIYDRKIRIMNDILFEPTQIKQSVQITLSELALKEIKRSDICQIPSVQSTLRLFHNIYRSHIEEARYNERVRDIKISTEIGKKTISASQILMLQKYDRLIASSNRLFALHEAGVKTSFVRSSTDSISTEKIVDGHNLIFSTDSLPPVEHRYVYEYFSSIVILGSDDYLPKNLSLTAVFGTTKPESTHFEPEDVGLYNLTFQGAYIEENYSCAYWNFTAQDWNIAEFCTLYQVNPHYVCECSKINLLISVVAKSSSNIEPIEPIDFDYRGLILYLGLGLIALILLCFIICVLLCCFLITCLRLKHLKNTKRRRTMPLNIDIYDDAEDPTDLYKDSKHSNDEEDFNHTSGSKNITMSSKRSSMNSSLLEIDFDEQTENAIQNHLNVYPNTPISTSKSKRSSLASISSKRSSIGSMGYADEDSDERSEHPEYRRSIPNLNQLYEESPLSSTATDGSVLTERSEHPEFRISIKPSKP